MLKGLKRIFLTLCTVALATALVGSLFVVWGYYYYVARDLPKLSRIEDYRPPAVTRVLARDGSLIAEFFSERRYPVKLAEVPAHVRKAFLAAEDAAFYSHSGIDPISILRAIFKNIQTGNKRQGASTITQQVVKNLLLSSQRTYARKAREAVLSYRLERRFSKDEIFEIYLNQIFFGNSAYGVKAAARLYFHKELSEISLAEAAYLAGLPKGPSVYSPLNQRKAARQRQQQVLKQMVEAGFIREDERQQAEREKVTFYRASQQNVFASPYYVGEIRRVFAERWKGLDLDSDGLEVTTAVEPAADELASAALRKGLRAVDKRRGWRGPIGHLSPVEYNERYGTVLAEGGMKEGELYPALVRSVVRGVAKVTVGDQSLAVDLNEAGWAKKFIENGDAVRFGVPAERVKEGDLLEVSLAKVGTPGGVGAKEPRVKVVLDQTPQVEGAVVLMDPHSGEVRSMIGGYSYAQSQFNRVTQSLRQPGSSFKPVVYLAALDKFKYTPATIVYDVARTFRIGDTFWTPANFDEKFLGPITLRMALERSRNLVSADIVSRIGVDAVIQYARMLGITSPLGRNLSLSLGAAEVSVLEMTRAYGVLAAKGLLFDSVFVTQIKDRYGKVLYSYDNERLARAKQVLNENSAFVLATMMKGVIESGTGYKVKELGRPVAGKTGTSNDQMDAWFIGFTPTWVCGVWVGFDQKRQIGPKETGGMVSAPIWLDFMRDFIKLQGSHAVGGEEREAQGEAERLGIQYVPVKVTEQLDFSVPDGVEPFWVVKATGARASAGTAGAILEYFVKGTEPEEHPVYTAVEGSAGEANAASYLESPDL
jgi:penicillin-binding protein 1A